MSNIENLESVSEKGKLIDIPDLTVSEWVNEALEDLQEIFLKLRGRRIFVNYDPTDQYELLDAVGEFLARLETVRPEGEVEEAEEVQPPHPHIPYPDNLPPMGRAAVRQAEYLNIYSPEEGMRCDAPILFRGVTYRCTLRSNHKGWAHQLPGFDIIWTSEI